MKERAGPARDTLGRTGAGGGARLGGSGGAGGALSPAVRRWERSTVKSQSITVLSGRLRATLSTASPAALPVYGVAFVFVLTAQSVLTGLTPTVLTELTLTALTDLTLTVLTELAPTVLTELTPSDLAGLTLTILAGLTLTVLTDPRIITILVPLAASQEAGQRT